MLNRSIKYKKFEEAVIEILNQVEEEKRWSLYLSFNGNSLVMPCDYDEFKENGLTPVNEIKKVSHKKDNVKQTNALTEYELHREIEESNKILDGFNP